VAIIETGSVAAVRQTIEIAHQTRIERPTGNGVINRLPVALAGARKLLGRLGAALDFQ
jgi:hypothetical protein